MHFNILNFFLAFLLLFNGLPGGEWKRVYLATYPRSGNHWIRNLIEEATHIATGSVYCDQHPVHLEKPFPWGGFCAEKGCIGNCRYPKKGDIVVIKTHFPAIKAKQFDCRSCEKFVRIVRHPVDSLYSFYVHRADEPPQDKLPEAYLRYKIYEWKKFQNYWNEQENVLTIRYEDLLENPHSTLKNILSYIGYRVKDKDIERAVLKFPPYGSPLKHLDAFSKEGLIMIEHELKELMDQFQYDILEITNKSVS